MIGLSQLFRHLRNKGLLSTFQRGMERVRRFCFIGKHVVYSCDLPSDVALVDGGLVVEELYASDVGKTHRIITHWDEEVAAHQTNARFRMGARLWVARIDSELAAYGWTIRGQTVASYFFPLCNSDIHFFDFFVFEEFRGVRVNPRFVSKLLSALGSTGERRAYIECAAWNDAQLRSLARTPFRRLGYGRKISLGSFSATIWSKQ